MIVVSQYVIGRRSHRTPISLHSALVSFSSTTSNLNIAQIRQEIDF